MSTFVVAAILLILCFTTIPGIIVKFGWGHPPESNPWMLFVRIGIFWVYAHATNNYVIFMFISIILSSVYLYAHYAPFWETKLRKPCLVWPPRTGLLNGIAQASSLQLYLAGIWEIVENFGHLIMYLADSPNIWWKEVPVDSNVDDIIMALLSIILGVIALVFVIPPAMGVFLVAHRGREVIVVLIIIFGAYCFVATGIANINIVVGETFVNLGFILHIIPTLLIFRFLCWYHERIAKRLQGKFIRVNDVRRFYLYIYVYLIIMWVAQVGLTWYTYPAVIVGNTLFIIVSLFLRFYVLSPLRKRRKCRRQKHIVRIRVRFVITKTVIVQVVLAFLLIVGVIVTSLILAIIWRPTWLLTWNFRGKLMPDPPENIGHLSILNENVHRTFSHWLNPFLFYILIGSIAFYPITICKNVYSMGWIFTGRVPESSVQTKRNWPPSHWLPYVGAASFTGAFVVLWKMIDTVFTILGMQSFNLTGQDATLGETMICNVCVVIASALTYIVYPPLPGLLFGGSLIYFPVHLLMYAIVYAALRILPGLYILSGNTNLIPLGFYFIPAVVITLLIIMENVDVAIAKTVHQKQKVVSENDVRLCFRMLQSSVLIYWIAFWGFTVHSYIAYGIGVVMQILVTLIIWLVSRIMNNNYQKLRSVVW